jgi:aspartyl-tRNA(Asn)/glutamyl-tRNA(Gln) amidotransferase subunit A
VYAEQVPKGGTHGPRDELCYMSIRKLGEMMRRKEVSSFELTQAILDRIVDVDRKVGAYITVLADEALDAARRCDAELAVQDRGPLHGIPVALKDVYDTRGARTTAGSKILADRVPDKDATTVAQLRAAGAVIVGKCNMHEFAYGVTTENPHYGTTHNPWNLERIAGGSSGGSAAAVAAGLCIASTGNDSGGSVRLPAALCGVVGLKPTLGRISCYGLVGSQSELDCPGPLTRSVWDAAAMLEVMAGWDVADPMTVRCPVPHYTAHLTGDVRGLRVGVDPSFALKDSTSEIGQAFEVALEVLIELGVEVADVHVPRVEQGSSAGLTVFMSETAVFHADSFATRAAEYGADVRARLARGAALTGQDYARAQRTRRLLARDFELLFENVNLFATPTCGVTAPALGERQVSIGGEDIPVVNALTHFTRAFNLVGLPAISVPCGICADGLPLGLQLVGPSFGEITVLRVAHAYEQATEWHTLRPRLASDREF